MFLILEWLKFNQNLSFWMKCIKNSTLSIQVIDKQNIVLAQHNRLTWGKGKTKAKSIIIWRFLFLKSHIKLCLIPVPNAVLIMKYIKPQELIDKSYSKINFQVFRKYLCKKKKK